MEVIVVELFPGSDKQDYLAISYLQVPQNKHLQTFLHQLQCLTVVTGEGTSSRATRKVQATEI